MRNIREVTIGLGALLVAVVGAPRQAHAQACASCITLPWTTGSCSSAGSCINVGNTATSGGVGIEGQVQGLNGTAFFGDATSVATGGTGVEGLCEATAGNGVFGLASNTAGTSSFGVYGTNAATGTFSPAGNGYGSGVYGSSAGQSSVGVYGTSTGATSAGMLGYSAVASGIGVSGQATGTGNSWGVFGSSTSPGGGGVIGWATGTGGGGYGVAGEASTTVSGAIGVFGSGAVGVSAVSPVGDAILAQTTSGTGVYATSTTGTGVYASSTGSGSGSPALYAYNSGAGHFAAYFNGNIQVTGTPYCSGCTAFTNNSDRRLKKNVEPMKGALDTLLKLQGVTFEWKDPKEHGDHQGTQRGFIAQDVEKVIPEWVGVDSKGFKTLNLTGIEAMTVESVRALKAENDELRITMSALEAGRRPTISGFGEGGIGLGVLAIVGALATNRRRRRGSAEA